MAYEYLNYALALGGLALLYWLARRLAAAARPGPGALP